MVIQAIKLMTRIKSPTRKLRALVRASNAILICVDNFYHNKTQSVFMGAEEKFPILIYSIIKANVPLWSHYHYIDDFVNSGLADPESSYRTDELQSVLKYISTLDPKIRDEMLVLIPYHELGHRLKWAVTHAIADIPNRIRYDVVQVFLKIVENIGRRPEGTDTHRPLEGSLFSDEDKNLLQSQSVFYDETLSKVGLKMTIPVPSVPPESQIPGQDQLQQATSDSLGLNIEITFIHKLPLSLYLKMGEIITELTTNRKLFPDVRTIQ